MVNWLESSDYADYCKVASRRPRPRRPPRRRPRHRRHATLASGVVKRDDEQATNLLSPNQNHKKTSHQFGLVYNSGLRRSTRQQHSIYSLVPAV